MIDDFNYSYSATKKLQIKDYTHWIFYIFSSKQFDFDVFHKAYFMMKPQEEKCKMEIAYSTQCGRLDLHT